VEDVKTKLFLSGTKTSMIVQDAMKDINSLMKPHTQRFSKKNDIRPFEGRHYAWMGILDEEVDTDVEPFHRPDPSSLEFFSEKTDCSLLVMGHHSKKRPHALTIARTFNYKILDLLELYIDPNSQRTLQQFAGGANRNIPVGLKPILSFSGTPFESPTTTPYTLAKSMFLDLFRGEEAKSIHVEGLRYMISFIVAEETETSPKPEIHMRCYTLRTLRSPGSKLPRVELDEMGPRLSFRVGRSKLADEDMWKEAMKKPRGTEERTKKNIGRTDMGDKVGRIHVGRQDLSTLQTRKMKGLKRGRGEVDSDVEMHDVQSEEELDGLIGSDQNEVEERPRSKKGRI
jgi:ribosome production factor 2